MNLAPADARAEFRGGLVTPTAGWSPGYTQANLIVVPRDWAWDMLLFAQRNPKPCPVLDVLEAGAVGGPLLDGDVRTDVPLYRVFVDGELTQEGPDVTDWWREDLVSFLIGCSFTFEDALIRAQIPVRHIERGVNVPMYRTSRRCRPAGRFDGPLVVSMRYIPAALVDEAVRVTARYPAVHGAPVHVGDPSALGINDLNAPDHGDAVVPEPGDVPVFWACGVTPQEAVLESRPPLAITHAPGHMLITDALESGLSDALPDSLRDMAPRALVEEFWAAMQLNDWTRAAAVLAPECAVDWPCSGERIVGREDFVAVQVRYPSRSGRWSFDVHRLVADGSTVVSEVTVTDGQQSARVVTYSEVDGDEIVHQVEYWLAAYDPPPGREDLTRPIERVP